MKNRLFARDTLIHCYQRTADRGILFYSYSDHIVHFTQYCTVARKYNIRVLSLCQMPDHIHDSVQACRKTDLEKFKRETNSGFARQWNEWRNVRGPVFESPFGSALKYGTKQIRTNLIYVGNNPVERKIVMVAEKYRWNYLAYAVSDHPFSEKLVIRRARWPLQRAVKEVKALYNSNLPVNYSLLKRLFALLDNRERMQLTDYIISLYNVIDYKAAIKYFGRYEDMLAAMHVTTGSEYDLHETHVGKSDVCYAQMTEILIQQNIVRDINELLALTMDDKFELFIFLQGKTGAQPEQIAKFLHVPLNIKRCQ